MWAGAIGTVGAAPAGGERGSRRRRIALLATEVRKHSHAQHFIDRFTEGYGWEGRHHHPPLELAGLYVDQVPTGDLSRDRVRRHRLTLYPTVEEAITLGCSDAAAIRHLAGAAELVHARSAIIELGALSRFERPLPVVTDYDGLLGQKVAP